MLFCYMFNGHPLACQTMQALVQCRGCWCPMKRCIALLGSAKMNWCHQTRWSSAEVSWCRDKSIRRRTIVVDGIEPQAASLCRWVEYRKCCNARHCQREPIKRLSHEYAPLCLRVFFPFENRASPIARKGLGASFSAKQNAKRFQTFCVVNNLEGV